MIVPHLRMRFRAWLDNGTTRRPERRSRSTQQARQAEFMSRDFSQERHRHAACKNAYVLLGQHRHQLAAAFFILGEKLIFSFLYFSCLYHDQLHNKLTN